MSDDDSLSSELDLLTARMTDLAREIGEMEPNDPVRAVQLKELYRLTELNKLLNKKKRLSIRQ